MFLPFNLQTPPDSLDVWQYVIGGQYWGSELAVLFVPAMLLAMQMSSEL
jgi:hypothetical protein